MNITLFISLIFFFQIICLIVGKRSSRSLNNSEDYFLASKKVMFFPLMMTFIATQLGGGLILGAADEAYHYGWFVLLYPLGNCLGFALLALGIGKRLARFQVSTVAQLFEVVYGSVKLKQVASILSILSLFMILAAQVIASKKFLISIGADEMILFLAFWAIVIFYTAMGGLKAIVSIGIIQTLCLIVIFVAGFVYALYTVPLTAHQILHDGFNTNFFELNIQKLSGWLLMPLLFMVIEQDMAQRCFAAQSPNLVTRAAGCAGIVVFAICVIPIYFAVVASQLDLEIAIASDSSIFMDAVQALSNPIFTAFMGCVVMMAVISSSISYLNALSSNLSQDFDLKLFGKGINNTRWLTALIGATAVGGSFFFGGIIDLLILSFEIPVYCLFVSVVFALFQPKGNSRSALFAMIGGAIGFILTRIWLPPFPKEILCLAMSFTGFAIGINLWIPLRSKLNLNKPTKEAI